MANILGILLALLTLMAGPLMALPAEDHWSGAARTPYEGRGLVEAQGLIAAQRYDAALSILTALAMARPGDADVHNLLGFAHRKSGNLAAAAPAYATALRLNPYHRGALEYQGELFLRLNAPARAEANLKRLRALCGECAESLALGAAITRWRAGR